MAGSVCHASCPWPSSTTPPGHLALYKSMAGKRFQAILLPGGVLPAEFAYPPLLDALGDDVDGRAKELEMYAADAPPTNYTLQTEIDDPKQIEIVGK